MFHAVIILIATCFGCTLYHFYAFSETNLLTRCHSASALFSAVFRFRNPRQEISSESNEINSTINKLSRRYRSPEGTLGGHPRAPRHRRARPWWDPRRAMAWGPHLAPDVPLSPINSLSRENPRRIVHIPRKVPSRPSSSISDRRSSEALPGILTEGRSSPAASTPPCLPPE